MKNKRIGLRNNDATKAIYNKIYIEEQERIRANPIIPGLATIVPHVELDTRTASHLPPSGSLVHLKSSHPTAPRHRTR